MSNVRTKMMNIEKIVRIPLCITLIKLMWQLVSFGNEGKGPPNCLGVVEVHTSSNIYIFGFLAWSINTNN